MPNLIINTVCNLRCPYCFADDCKANNKNQNMTYEKFKEIINFVTQTDKYIGILGGEPTIHPDFDRFMCDIIANDNINNSTVFTNGIEVDKHLGIFSAKKIGILVNFNNTEVTGSKSHDKIMSNLELLHDLRKEHIATGLTESNMLNSINLGLNLYKKDQDFTEILEALKTFNKHSLRLSVTVPNSTDKKHNDPLKYFEEMKPTLMNLLDKLAMIDVSPHTDCNYVPLCIFSDKEIEYLSRMFTPIANKYNVEFNMLRHQYCENGPLDIYPDGTVARCFGFSEYDRQNIQDYRNIDDIRYYFKRTIEQPSFLTCSTEKCKTCYNHKVQLCSGGCLSYKFDKLKEIRKYGENL